MKRRLKIKVVGGSWGEHLTSHIWSDLAQFHDIEFLILASDALTRVSTTIPITVFPELREMPGYYRDLERYLKDADLVIGIEWARLSTFQSLRIAKNLNIPCVVVVHELETSSDSSLMNVQAIKYDIALNADHFITFSSRVKRSLLREGIQESRISNMELYPDLNRFKFSKVLRNKFRKYTGIGENEGLFVVCTSMESGSIVKSTLLGFKKFIALSGLENEKKWKMMLLGEGSRVEEFKYLAADLGIGSRVVFLCQEPSLFWADLTSAADVIIFDKLVQVQGLEKYPFSVAQAAVSGAACVLPTGGFYDELKLDHSRILRLSDFSPFEIEDVLFQCKDFYEIRLSNLADSNEVIVPVIERTKLALLGVLDNLTKSSLRYDWSERASRFITQYGSVPSLQDESHQLLAIEELLLNSEGDCNLLGDLLRIKGDLLALKRLGTEAISAYENSISFNAKSYRALRGLGFIAFESHSHEEAMVFFRRALCIEPNDYHTLVGIGLIYRRLRMLDEGLFWLEKAADIGGPDSTAIMLIVQACLERPDSSKSLKTLESLRESFGDSSLIVTSLNQIYSVLGKEQIATIDDTGNCA